MKCWSTWGHASVLGITEIEVYNQNGNKIPLMPGMIGLKNIGSGGSANVSRLIDGVSNTTDNKHMWVASIP